MYAAMTHHARVRLQQRGIPKLIVELLYRHGREVHQDGSTVIHLDERAIRKAQEELRDTLMRFDKLADAYLIESASNGAVVTVGHRIKRISRR
jgi:hypothetical protein